MTPLSPAALSVWGKSDRQPLGDHMPLVRHLRDSADVADYVWAWLPAHVQHLIEGALPEPARDGRRLLRWLAGVHDVGKCSPQFAYQMSHLADRMRDQRFAFPKFPHEYAAHRHELVGHLALREWLIERHGASAKTATTYAVVVGGHHGRPPSNWQLNDLEDTPVATGRGLWHETQWELLDHIADHVGVTHLLARWARSPLPTTVQALLTGAVIVSDWVASNPELFPYGSGVEDRGRHGWESLDLPPPWMPTRAPTAAADHCAARFPHLAGLPLRAPQQMALEAARAAGDVPLMIVEAAMGQGKTEAGLLAAEVLAHRFGCGGVYVALPTMATSDAMFSRVLAWIEQLGGGQRLSTFLAHSKAKLNDDYQGLMHRPRVADVCEDDGASEALVLSWLNGRKTGALATMSVGTVDQLLFLALQAKHVALRHLAFAGKVVIVDEVHAADDYMRVYLERALEWLGAYRVPVVLMSATLPRHQRQSLADAYRRGLGAPSTPLPTDTPYPALTSVTASSASLISAPGEPSTHRVHVACLDDDLDALVDQLEALLADGGCAAVIRNTVTRAQETAQRLRERLPEVEVQLVHSRFIATHRARKEAELRRRLGADGDRPHRLIVVGTQVLEQSLDVDFDVMVTDLAPVDLLLQRAGRLHRHQRGVDQSDRPVLLRTPHLLITGIAAWPDGVPEPVGPSMHVYRAGRLLRAAAVLGLAPGRAITLSLPDDIRPLVETAYADAVPGPSSWHAAIAAADGLDAQHHEEQRSKASTYLLPPPSAGRDLVNWLEAGARTEADDARSGVSRVRDGDESIEVLVVRRAADGEVRCFDDDRRAVYLQGEPPPPEVARAVAASSLRLPGWMTRSDADFEGVVSALEREAHASWLNSPWLKGQLALHLDEELSCSLGPFRLAYDLNDGLIAERVTSDG